MALPTPDMRMRSKYKTNPTTVSLTTTTARSTALTEGLYWVYTSAACFFLQGSSAVNATTSSIPLPTGVYFEIHVEAADTSSLYVAGITASGTATLSIIKQEP